MLRPLLLLRRRLLLLLLPQAVHKYRVILLHARTLLGAKGEPASSSSFPELVIGCPKH